MRLVDLSLDTRQSIAKLRFDLFTEKHEGPWQWKYWLENERVEFLQVDGFDVLLPEPRRPQEYYDSRVLLFESGLTIFLRYNIELYGCRTNSDL